jgi:hypothetical protein
MARYPFRPKDEPYWLGEVLAHEARLVWLLDPDVLADEVCGALTDTPRKIVA